MSDQDSVVTALLDPGVYGVPGPVEHRETHISHVFLAGEHAYKLKKEVVLPFVDYGTLERRRFFCYEEVRLNRRLAPSLYLGVRAVVPAASGVVLAGGGDPRAIEYVVEMRRFDERRTLAALVDTGEAGQAVIARLGALLASFHRGAAVVCGRSGAEILRTRLEADLAELQASAQGLPDPRELATVAAAARAFAARCARDLDERARAGLVREGHGDLRLEHVIVEDELEVVDCVEFDPALRTGDVALDLAFTLMGLHAINRRDLAQALVDAYRETGGDPGSDALVHGLAGCRALVRAKVAAIRADLLHAAGGERRAGLAEAGRLTALARRLFWRARLPLTIVVCGPAASGKTTLAAELARVSGLAHLSSDAIRKELEGVEPATPLPESGYSPQASARTYGELARRAREEAERGGGTLVDATFRLRRDRAAFREQLGEATGRLVVLSCQAAPELAAARAAGRLRDPATASDAGPERAIAQAREFEAFSEGWLARAITLPTDRPVAEVAARAEAAVDEQLAIR